MSEGALQQDYYQPVSALEASQQVLHGNLLHLTQEGQGQAVAAGVGEVRNDDDMLSGLGAVAAAEAVALEAADESETSRHILPPTTLDTERVKVILVQSKNSAEDDHIIELLELAWRGTSIVERPLPGELAAFAPRDLEGWYRQQSEAVKRLIRERIGLADIYDQTDKYEDGSPLLRNANTVQDMAINRHARFDGLCVQVAARLLLLEAIRARNTA